MLKFFTLVLCSILFIVGCGDDVESSDLNSDVKNETSNSIIGNIHNETSTYPDYCGHSRYDQVRLNGHIVYVEIPNVCSLKEKDHGDPGPEVSKPWDKTSVRKDIRINTSN